MATISSPIFANLTSGAQTSKAKSRRWSKVSFINLLLIHFNQSTVRTSGRSSLVSGQPSLNSLASVGSTLPTSSLTTKTSPMSSRSCLPEATYRLVTSRRLFPSSWSAVTIRCRWSWSALVSGTSTSSLFWTRSHWSASSWIRRAAGTFSALCYTMTIM